jgi:GNAT superfamily N-acetyltransferase
MSMVVRQAGPADAELVCLFNSLLAEESEGKKLDMTTLRPGVAAVLGDAHKGYYFLAEEDGAIIGQLALTYEWSDWRNGWFWWIQSVYVRKEARRKGVFRALFDHVVERARSDGGVIGIRLYVESDNHVAHAVYRDMGLEWTSYKVMERFPL